MGGALTSRGGKDRFTLSSDHNRTIADHLGNGDLVIPICRNPSV
jgi:hypothetical protein